MLSSQPLSPLKPSWLQDEFNPKNGSAPYPHVRKRYPFGMPLTIHKQGKCLSLLHLVSRVCKDNSVVPSVLFSCFSDH